MRQCKTPNCGEYPLSEFYQDKYKRKDGTFTIGYSTLCKKCYINERKKRKGTIKGRMIEKIKDRKGEKTLPHCTCTGSEKITVQENDRCIKCNYYVCWKYEGECYSKKDNESIELDTYYLSEEININRFSECLKSVPHRPIHKGETYK